MLAAGGSGGQWWQSLPVVLCYACSYLPGVMLAAGGSLCRGQSLGGQSAAAARSYIQRRSLGICIRLIRHILHDVAGLAVEQGTKTIDNI